jgi:HSP20 family protein
MWKEPWGFSTRIFEEMDKEFAELSRLFSGIQESGSSAGGRLPYYYGYQVTVGPDGKPHVREFGNVRPSSRELVGQVGQVGQFAQTPSVREPLVDAILDEKQNTLVITAEMPGITKEDVKIHIGEGVVTLHAEKGEKKYHKEIPVEHELDEHSAKAAYTNGIVELKIKLKAAAKKKGRDVKVE